VVGEAPAGALPSLAEAQGWGGFELDDADGRQVGRVAGVYADAEDGGPVWLVVVSGRRRRAKTVVVPLRECAAMPGRVWTAQGFDAMRGAPAVDPSRPLLREHEIAICAHYGIGARIGRHAEVAGRPAETITAQPA
jgi:hypothetical protein